MYLIAAGGSFGEPSSHVGQLVDAEVRMVDPFELVPHKWRYRHEGDSAPSLPRQLLHILHVTYLYLTFVSYIPQSIRR